MKFKIETYSGGQVVIAKLCQQLFASGKSRTPFLKNQTIKQSLQDKFMITFAFIIPLTEW